MPSLPRWLSAWRSRLRLWLYVDPSVVTYAVQAIAGVAVAVSAVVGVAFRKVRARIMDLLGIDPSSKKEKDASFVAFGEGNDDALSMTPDEAFRYSGGSVRVTGTDVAHRGKRENAAARLRAGREFNPAWPVRFLIALLITSMSLGTLLIVAPIEIVVGSASDFFFKPPEIAAAIAPQALQAVILTALVMSCFSWKAFAVAASAVFAVGLGFYVQAMALNTGLPLADGRTVDWTRFALITDVSTIVWVCLIVAAVALAFKRTRLACALMPVVSLALVLVQGAGLAAALTGSDLVDVKSEGRDIVINEAGLFEASPEDNVVVFVLDTYDNGFLEDTLVKYPGLLKEFTGFTWYDNPVGSMTPTRYAIPFLLTGVMPDVKKGWDAWQKTRYADSGFLQAINEAGYSVYLYTNEAYIEMSDDEQLVEDIVDLVGNWNRDGYLNELDAEGAYHALVGCALYRDLPWVLKPGYRFNTPDVSAAMLADIDESAPEATTYIHDDVLYFKKLQERGLSLEEPHDAVEDEGRHAASGSGDAPSAQGGKGSFKFIHLMGAHYPYTIDDQGRRVETSTMEAQCAGSMRMVERYIKEMKELGVYDDATIIITADHGNTTRR